MGGKLRKLLLNQGPSEPCYATDTQITVRYFKRKLYFFVLSWECLLAVISTKVCTM